MNVLLYFKQSSSMNTGLIILLILLYLLIVMLGIRLLLADKRVPPHLKVLGVIVILAFNAIPVVIYLFIKHIQKKTAS